MRIGNMVTLTPEEWNNVEIVLGYSWALIACRSDMTDHEYETAKGYWMHYITLVNESRELEVPYE